MMVKDFDGQQNSEKSAQMEAGVVDVSANAEQYSCG